MSLYISLIYVKKITPHYAKLGDKLLFKNVFPKSGPKYRRHVVNPLITGDHINLHPF